MSLCACGGGVGVVCVEGEGVLCVCVCGGRGVLCVWRERGVVCVCVCRGRGCCVSVNRSTRKRGKAQPKGSNTKLRRVLEIVNAGFL